MIVIVAIALVAGVLIGGSGIGGVLPVPCLALAGIDGRKAGFGSVPGARVSHAGACRPPRPAGRARARPCWRHRGRAIRPHTGRAMVNGGFDIAALRADYGDVRAEAMSCRSAAALFDFSFMSRVRIEGPGANELIATFTPRRIDDLTPGRIRYALRVAADGRVLGDFTIWRLDAASFEIFSGSDDGLGHLQPPAGSIASVSDLSSETAILAVQGPASLRALSAAGSAAELRSLPYFVHVRTNIAGWPALSDASATPANAASKLSCRAPRVTWSGRRLPAMRVRRGSPPRTFCGSKRASSCSRTSCVFQYRLRSSSLAGSQPKRALHAGITRQNESSACACSASKLRAIASRCCGSRHATHAFRPRPAAFSQHQRAGAS